jgi:uncharacterized membrane protein
MAVPQQNRKVPKDAVVTSFALSSRASSARPLDARPVVRAAIALSAGVLSALLLYGLLRWVTGAAPSTPWVRDTALAIHLWTVIPAIPLGGYVMLARKGTVRHRLLGRLWMALMLVTAGSTVFIRNLNNGQFSWIHLLTLLTMIALPLAILSARQHRIADHRRHMLVFYSGSMLIAGFFTLLPGRTMWLWAFG